MDLGSESSENRGRSKIPRRPSRSAYLTGISEDQLVRLKDRLVGIISSGRDAASSSHMDGVAVVGSCRKGTERGTNEQAESEDQESHRKHPQFQTSGPRNLSNVHRGRLLVN